MKCERRDKCRVPLACDIASRCLSDTIDQHQREEETAQREAAKKESGE